MKRVTFFVIALSVFNLVGISQPAGGRSHEAAFLCCNGGDDPPVCPPFCPPGNPSRTER